jgi:hypothetical protein
MPVETDEDRLAFINPDEFGVVASYTSREPGALPTPINGQFDAEGSNWNPNRWNGTEYQMQNGAHMESEGPTFLCRTSDLNKGGRQRDVLVISEVTYRVEGKKPDGTGFTVLLLLEVD